MRVRFVSIGLGLVVAFALMSETAAICAIAQDNTNQSTTNSNASRRRKGRARRTPPKTSTPEAAPPATDTTAATQTAAPQTTGKRRRGRGKSASMGSGVPTGVGNCIDQLIRIAERDPLVPYEGRPEEIVNNGLMWNDPKSKCSAGTDAALRKKIFDMANAWRMGDSAQVRSLLQEIKAAAPQG